MFGRITFLEAFCPSGIQTMYSLCSLSTLIDTNMQTLHLFDINKLQTLYNYYYTFERFTYRPGHLSIHDAPYAYLTFGFGSYLYVRMLYLYSGGHVSTQTPLSSNFLQF